MTRRTALSLYVIFLAILIYALLNAPIFKDASNAASSSPAAQAAEVEVTTTTAPRTTTTAPATNITRAVPAPTVPVVTTTAPAAVVSNSQPSCARLDINLAAATLTARCTDGNATMKISSGSGEWYFNPTTGKQDKADTPTGHFSVYAMDPGWVEAPLGWMYNSMYFLGGFAIHGDPLVPSHGCVHVTEAWANWLFARVYIGTTVNIS